MNLCLANCSCSIWFPFTVVPSFRFSLFLNCLLLAQGLVANNLGLSLVVVATPPEQIDLSAVTGCIEKAKAEGKGAFFCMPPADGQDTSALQTFMGVQSAEVIDGKGITQKKMQGQSIDEVMEDVRKQIVNAMKHGRMLYIDLRNGAPSLTTDYCIDDKFPLEIWGATDHEKVRNVSGVLVHNAQFYTRASFALFRSVKN